MKKMFATFAAAIALAFSGNAMAFGDGPGYFDMGTGKPGKAYHTYGGRVIAIAKEVGFETDKKSNKPSRGAEMNIMGVYKGQIVAAFTQFDAYVNLARKYPDLPDRVKIWARMGEECVFLAGNKEGKVTHEDDLEDKISIGIDYTGSGTAQSWQSLVNLNPDMKDATPTNDAGVSGLSQVEAKTLDAMIFTTAPKFTNHANFRFIEQSPMLKLYDLDDSTFNNKYKGRPIYVFRDVKVAGQTVEVPCTDMIMIGSADVDDFYKDQLIETILLRRNSIMK